MKKILMMAASLVLMFSMAACSKGASPEEAVQAVVDEYLTDCKNADFSAADKLINPDGSMESLDEVFLSELSELEEMGMSQEITEKWKNMMGSIVAECFQSWTIESTEVKDDQATVIVSIKGIDEDSLGDALNADLGGTVMLGWIAENEDKVNAFMESDPTEGEIINWMFEQITPIMEEQVKTQVEKMDVVTSKYKFELSKADDQWLIDSMDEE